MLAIRAAGFFDGQTHHDGPVLILVTAGKITEIDRTGAAPPREAELADLGPLTVLPGFVDAHTHLAWDPHGMHEHLVTDTEAALYERARRHAESALRVGVTTVRDLGDRAYVTMRLRDDDHSPEVLTAGPPLTTTGGHCWFLGGLSVTAHAHATNGIAATIGRCVEHYTFHTGRSADLDPRIVDSMVERGIWAGITLSRPRDDRAAWIEDIVTGSRRGRRPCCGPRCASR